jgi:hypothetical protein
MRLRIVAISLSMGAAALMSSSAHAQNATPAEIEKALGQATPMAQAGEMKAYQADVRRTTAQPTPQNAQTPAGRVSLFRPATKAAGSMSSAAWTDWKPVSDDISASLRR